MMIRVFFRGILFVIAVIAVASSTGVYNSQSEFGLACLNEITSQSMEVFEQDDFAHYLNGQCQDWNCDQHLQFEFFPFQIQIVFARATCANAQPVNLSPHCASYQEGGEMGIYLGEQRPVTSYVAAQVEMLCIDLFPYLLDYDIVRLAEGEPSLAPQSSPIVSGPVSEPPVDQLTDQPTGSPTFSPINNPTSKPTHIPTRTPTRSPTQLPTKFPTQLPTKLPTKLPTTLPTKLPTKLPTTLPTKLPTKRPTKSPTQLPTKSPTRSPIAPGDPTHAPTKSFRPTMRSSRPTTSSTEYPTTMTFPPNSNFEPSTLYPTPYPTTSTVPPNPLYSTPYPTTSTFPPNQNSEPSPTTPFKPTPFPSIYFEEDFEAKLYYQLGLSEESDVRASDVDDEIDNSIRRDLMRAFEKLVETYDERSGRNLRHNNRRRLDIFYDTSTFDFIEDGALPDLDCPSRANCIVISSRILGKTNERIDVVQTGLTNFVRETMQDDYFITLLNNSDVISVSYGGSGDFDRSICLQDCDDTDSLSTVEATIIGAAVAVTILAYPVYRLIMSKGRHSNNEENLEKKSSSQLLPIGGQKVIARFHKTSAKTYTNTYDDWEGFDDDDDPNIDTASDDEEDPIVTSLPQPFPHTNQSQTLQPVLHNNNIQFNPAPVSHYQSPHGVQGNSQPDFYPAIPTFSKSLSSSASFQENKEKLTQVIESGDWTAANKIAQSINHTDSRVSRGTTGTGGMRSISPLSSMHSRSESSGGESAGSVSRSSSSGSERGDESRPVAYGSPRRRQPYIESSDPSNSFSLSNKSSGEDNTLSRDHNITPIASGRSAPLSKSISSLDEDRSEGSSALMDLRPIPNAGGNKLKEVDSIQKENASENLKKQVQELLEKVAPDDVQCADDMIDQFRGREYFLLETLQKMHESKTRESEEGLINEGSETESEMNEIAMRSTFGQFSDDDSEIHITKEGMIHESQSVDEDFGTSKNELGYSLESKSMPTPLMPSKPHQSTSIAKDSSYIMDDMNPLQAAARIAPPLHRDESDREDDNEFVSTKNTTQALLDNLDNAIVRRDWDAVQKNASLIPEATRGGGKELRNLSRSSSFQRSSSSVGDISSAAEDSQRVAELEKQINLEDWQSIMNSAKLFEGEGSSANVGSQRVSARRGGIRQSLQGKEPEVKVNLSHSMDSEAMISHDGSAMLIATGNDLSDDTQVAANNVANQNTTSTQSQNVGCIDPLAMEWAITKGLRNLERLN